ncbi:hypothetical protein M0802_013329 [Mischocyttarus mexicanus]|nr:hypothetical protein M0802_013331 [Mischocyttarus mexicanus]KAI4483504.1 hypothetical protein M0802_013329 [Mischocyttarus mexicanus]
MATKIMLQETRTSTITSLTANVKEISAMDLAAAERKQLGQNLMRRMKGSCRHVGRRRWITYILRLDATRRRCRSI